MSNHDISREVFDPRKHYTGVRMQQGRVMLDSDWNEDQNIDLENHRRSHLHIIGPYGSPDRGFLISNADTLQDKIDFMIGEGAIYLGGLRFEMDESESYLKQKDWLQGPDKVDLPTAAELDIKDRIDLVYLEAWQQVVDAVQDGSLLEVALGGADTSSRLRNMRRVRVFSNVGTEDCASAWERLKAHWQESGRGMINDEFKLKPNVRLQVGFTGAGSSEGLCSPFMQGGYLGAENQLFRVQIVDFDPITGVGKFNWSYDNASSLYRINLADNGKVEFLTHPKDQHHWPLAGGTVELLCSAAELPNGEKIAEQSGHLSKVALSYNPSVDVPYLIIDNPPDPESGQEWKFLRHWYRGSDVNSEAETEFRIDEAIPLGNTGLEVTISGSDINREDYWLIAARPETPSKVEPAALLEEGGMPPHGVCRFFAPLALIRWFVKKDDLNRGPYIDGEVIQDCRKTFKPLTDLHTCCTYSVGDGKQSKGDFNSIQAAIDHLPASGGKICILPGIHQANAIISNRQNIYISGCGERTIIRPQPDDKNIEEPIFSIHSSRGITLEHLSLITIKGTAIRLEDLDKGQDFSQNINLHHNHIIAGRNAIHIETIPDNGGYNNISISHNQIGIVDVEKGGVGIFSLADRVRIERNKIFVTPRSGEDDPEVPTDPDDGKFDPEDPLDPCADIQQYYAPSFPLLQYTFNFFHSQAHVSATSLDSDFKACGGIQIGGTSEDVRIIDNEINGGRCNGITLGHIKEEVQDDIVVLSPLATVPQVTALSTDTIALASAEYQRQAVAPPKFMAIWMYNIQISGNFIQNMGLSGIGALSLMDLRRGSPIIITEELSICRNRIIRCALQTPEVNEVPNDRLYEIGFGGISLAVANDTIIRENRIENNGVHYYKPCCGIFIQHGERTVIGSNHILNNGPATFDSSQKFAPGLRAGIAIKMAISRDGKPIIEANEAMLSEGGPAIMIHDNIVSQPMGRALRLTAMGSASVTGNHLTTQHRDFEDPNSEWSAAVYILNLGRSSNAPSLTSYQSLAVGGQIATADLVPPTNTTGASLQYRRQHELNGEILFSNNQTVYYQRQAFVDRVKSAIGILTTDDLSYHGNQSKCAPAYPQQGAAIELLMTNTILGGYSIRANDNRFTERPGAATYSLISSSRMNTAIGNQSTHCLQTFGHRRTSLANLVRYTANCLYEHQTLSALLNIPDNTVSQL